MKMNKILLLSFFVISVAGSAFSVPDFGKELNWCCHKLYDRCNTSTKKNLLIAGGIGSGLALSAGVTSLAYKSMSRLIGSRPFLQRNFNKIDAFIGGGLKGYILAAMGLTSILSVYVGWEELIRSDFWRVRSIAFALQNSECSFDDLSWWINDVKEDTKRLNALYDTTSGDTLLHLLFSKFKEQSERGKKGEKEYKEWCEKDENKFSSWAWDYLHKDGIIHTSYDNYLEVVLKMLLQGADPQKKNKNGKAPDDLLDPNDKKDFYYDLLRECILRLDPEGLKKIISLLQSYIPAETLLEIINNPNKDPLIHELTVDDSDKNSRNYHEKSENVYYSVRKKQDAVAIYDLLHKEFGLTFTAVKFIKKKYDDKIYSSLGALFPQLLQEFVVMESKELMKNLEWWLDVLHWYTPIERYIDAEHDYTKRWLNFFLIPIIKKEDVDVLKYFLDKYPEFIILEFENIWLKNQEKSLLDRKNRLRINLMEIAEYFGGESESKKYLEKYFADKGEKLLEERKQRGEREYEKSKKHLEDMLGGFRKMFEPFAGMNGYDCGTENKNDTLSKEKALVILELDENATNEEIKKQYKKLANIYHPDKNIHLSSEEQKEMQKKFIAVNQAYERLAKKEETFEN